MVYLHCSHFGDVRWFQCIESRDGRVQSRDRFSEVVLTLVFDCFRCSSGFVRDCFVGRDNLETFLHQHYTVTLARNADPTLCDCCQTATFNYDNNTRIIFIRYDTIEEINMDSKAEYTA